MRKSKAETIAYAIKKECQKFSLYDWCDSWDITTDEFEEFLKLAVNNAEPQERDRLEQLKEYQQLEEQGGLVKLLCKVGEMLYYVDSYYDTVIPVRLDEVIIQFVGINNYAYQYNCCSFDGCGDVCEEYEFDNNDFGKTVFLTESEAEAKLKELRGIENSRKPSYDYMDLLIEKLGPFVVTDPKGDLLKECGDAKFPCKVGDIVYHVVQGRIN